MTLAEAWQRLADAVEQLVTEVVCVLSDAAERLLGR